MVDPRSKRYSATNYIPSFIGFADNVEPKLVIFTMLNSPKRAYYASETAAPLFANVFRAATARLNIPPDPKFVEKARSLVQIREDVEEQEAKETLDLPTDNPEPSSPTYASIERKNDAKWIGAGDGKWVMPSLVGLSPREVLQAMAGQDLKLQIKGFGRVKEQLPKPSAVVSKGDRIVVDCAPF